MRKKIGGYMAGAGALMVTTMGCCLDSAAWRTVLVLVIISFTLMVIGVKLMNIPETLEQKGFRFESKEIKSRKERNREETWKTWIAS